MPGAAADAETAPAIVAPQVLRGAFHEGVWGMVLSSCMQLQHVKAVLHMTCLEVTLIGSTEGGGWAMLCAGLFLGGMCDVVHLLGNLIDHEVWQQNYIRTFAATRLRG